MEKMMEIEKLMENIKKELKEVGEKGLTNANLESTSKLVDMLKDLKEIQSEGQEGGEYHRGGYGMNDYRMNGYGAMDGYGNRGYDARGYNEGGNGARGYNERGYGGDREYDYMIRGSRGYNGNDSRMRDHIGRISEGAEMYEYGRDRYQHGGSTERMEEGLEKLMYALCMFIESTMEFAQSPKEKEIIRKHVQKLRAM